MNKKYDIEILSLWSWENYGTNLTYYALYKVLKKMGYVVKMLERPLNSLAQPPRISENEKNKVGLFFNSPYQPSELQIPLETRGEMRNLTDECDTILVGSDQFFNNSVNNDFGKVFYLDWVPENIRKIAYAASWGRDEAWGTTEETKLMSYYLSRFDAFSVREKSSVDFIKKTYNRDSTFVLDPVFLCDKSNYEKLSENFEADLKDDYIFSYMLDPNSEKADVLRKISDKLHLPLKVVSDPHYTEEFIKENWDIPTELKVCEERWIAHIKNCKFMITDSFHGMCLAIIFKKNFIAISNPLRGTTRFDSMRQLFGIGNKIIESLETIDLSNEKLFENPDYEKISEILESESKRSEKWLIDALNIPVKEKKDFLEYDALKHHIEEVELNHFKKIKSNSERIANLEIHGSNVDNRFVGNEERIGNVEKHGVEVDNRLVLNEERIANIEKHGVDVDNRFVLNEERIANIEKHGVNVDNRFVSAEERLMVLEESFSVLINENINFKQKITRLEKLTGIWLLRKIKNLLKH